MGKRKKKKVHDGELYNFMKRLGRISGAKPTLYFEDKSKYKRKPKYKRDWGNNSNFSYKFPLQTQSFQSLII